MSPRSAPWWVRLLLWVYPRSFRDRHGEEIEEYVALELEAAGRGRRRRAMWMAWDLGRRAWRVRRAQRGGADHGNGRGWTMGTATDMRVALRGLVRSRGFSAVVVATLALAVGLNTALFGVVDSILLEPLPYERPEELVWVEGSLPEEGLGNLMLSAWRWRHLREGVPAVARLEAVATVRQNLLGAGLPRQVDVGWVSEGFLEMLGAEPVLGRRFAPGDGPGLVILSHGLWQETLGGDPGAVGRSVSLDGHPYTIVGVMPPGFQPELPGGRGGPLRVELWKSPDALWQNGNVWDETRADANGILRLVGRLAPGATVAEADQQAAAVTAALRAGGDGRERDIEVRIHGLTDKLVAPARPTLLVLAAAVGFVLLIACANVANLLLVRAQGRRRELALRVALGSPRSHLARFLLGEALLLAGAASAAGLALAWVLVGAVPRLAPPGLPRAGAVDLDAGVLLVGLACGLAATVLAGLAPAFHALRADPAAELGGGRAPTAGGRGRSVLVVAQVALSLILLVGGGLLVSSLVRMQRVPLGFDADGVMTFAVSVPGTKYGWPEDADRFYREVEQRVAALPGVHAAGVVWPMPFGGSWSGDVLVADGSERGLGVTPYHLATEAYFPTAGIPLLEGRLFAEGDERFTVVVSERVARRVAPDGSAVGRSITANPWGRGGTPFEIIGVVGDVRGRDLREEPAGGVYFDARGWSWVDWEVHVLARTGLAPAAFTQQVREVVASIDPEVPVARPEPLAARIERQTASTRFVMALLGVFAASAGLVALVGLYGVVSGAATQRRREIGIRMALGSGRSGVAGRVLKDGVVLAAVGVGIGTAGSLALGRFLESLLFGVRPGDPLTVVAAGALMLAAAAAASWLPAWRAARTDPAEVLKGE